MGLEVKLQQRKTLLLVKVTRMRKWCGASSATTNEDTAAGKSDHNKKIVIGKVEDTPAASVSTKMSCH